MSKHLRKEKQYCACGNEIKIQVHPVRNPRSYKTHHRYMKQHDLCRQCFRKLMNNELNRQKLE